MFTKEELDQLNEYINVDSLTILKDGMSFWQTLLDFRYKLEQIPIQNERQAEAVKHIANAVDMAWNLFQNEINGFRDDMKIAIGREP